MTITAHLPVGGVGSTIYFRLLDPDDASPYEPDAIENDNQGTSALSANSAVASLVNINGNDVAAAEVVLTFSNRSGDNFIVEASGDAAFPPAATQRTPMLVAWNRAYLELDNMYQHGATVTNRAMIATGATTTLEVDNTVSFTARNGSAPGTSVVIFTRDPFTVPGSGGQSSTLVREVLATTPTSIEVSRIGVEIPEFSGVKLASDNSGYTVSTDLIETGYGNVTTGSDGGAFIEFKRPIEGSRTVPLYAAFGATSIWRSFSLYWFANSAHNPVTNTSPPDNTFQLLSARQNNGSPYTGVLGLSRPEENISTVFMRNATTVFSTVTNRETVVHELGHQLNLPGGANGHVDLRVNAANIEGTDQCIMSYNQHQGTGHVKFDIDCYQDLRDIGVPQ